MSSARAIVTSIVDPDETNVFVIAAANGARKGLILSNNADKTVYVKFGDDCAADDYTIAIPAGEAYEMPETSAYSGLITGLSALAGTGQFQVTELVD